MARDTLFKAGSSSLTVAFRSEGVEERERLCVVSIQCNTRCEDRKAYTYCDLAVLKTEALSLVLNCGNIAACETTQSAT